MGNIYPVIICPVGGTWLISCTNYSRTLKSLGQPRVNGRTQGRSKIYDDQFSPNSRRSESQSLIGSAKTQGRLHYSAQFKMNSPSLTIFLCFADEVLEDCMGVSK